MSLLVYLLRSSRWILPVAFVASLISGFGKDIADSIDFAGRAVCHQPASGVDRVGEGRERLVQFMR